MRRKNVLATIAICAAIAGCASAEEVANTVDTAWVGHKADEFFVAYGPPAAQYKLDNGDRLLRWSSGVDNFTLPGSSNSFGTVSAITGTIDITTFTSPPTTLSLTCQLDLLVNPAGVIKDLRVSRDTIGVWQNSRCLEYLKLKVVKAT